MEKFIHAMMATMTAFLTSIAPVFAMENYNHIFNCEGHYEGQNIELAGHFTDTTGAMSIYDGTSLEMFTNVTVSTVVDKLGNPKETFISTHINNPRYGRTVTIANFHQDFFANHHAHVYDKYTGIEYDLTCQKKHMSW